MIWTQDKRDEAVRLLNLGMSRAQIAHAIGASDQAVRSYFDRHDIKRGYHGHPPELRIKARELHSQGVSRREIARQIGVNESSVRNWLPRREGKPKPLAGWPKLNRTEATMLDYCHRTGGFPALREAFTQSGRAAVVLRGRPIVSFPVSIRVQDWRVAA